MGSPPEFWFETLEPHHAAIVAMRFGIQRTLAECGEALNLSRDAVRAIEKEAIASLRERGFVLRMEPSERWYFVREEALTAGDAIVDRDGRIVGYE